MVRAVLLGLLRTMRPHQWVKNLFVVAPLFFAREVFDASRVQLTLAASNRVLTVPRGESLLTALEAAGLKPASGCRMGICNTCACGKREGTTRQLHTGETEREPVTALRLCVNAALTDLVLDL